MDTRASAAIFVAAFVALALPQAGLAKLYKWVDADGNVTYSERKPPDVEAQTIELRGARGSDAQAEESLERLRDRARTRSEDREFASSASAEKQAREERLRKNCEIARQNMRVLRNSSRIQDKDASGQPYFLDEEQIEARMEETAQQVEANCP